MVDNSSTNININHTVNLLNGCSLVFSHQPSFTKVLRDVKRNEHNLFNCIASILSDAQFVSQVASSLPLDDSDSHDVSEQQQQSLPVFSNLRCGLWYVDPTTTSSGGKNKIDKTNNSSNQQQQSSSYSCYFKSTDGHTGNWNFSTTRLNLNIATIAAQRGGVFIVDATRRGKRFPDAFTKTVPIWAAVLNRTIRQHRLLQQQQQHCSSNNDDSDNDLYLPDWVESTEKDQILQRIDSWVSNFLNTICLDTIDQLSTLTTTSSTNSSTTVSVFSDDGTTTSSTGTNGSNKSNVFKPFRCFWVSQCPDWRDQLPTTKDFEQCVPLVLISAALPNQRIRRRLTLDLGNSTIFDGMYEYIPGAADDEESWSRGLTPPLLWQYYPILLAAGTSGIEQQLQLILQQEEHKNSTTAGTDNGSGNSYNGGGGNDDINDDVCVIGQTGMSISASPQLALHTLSQKQKQKQQQEGEQQQQQPMWDAVLHVGIHNIHPTTTTTTNTTVVGNSTTNTTTTTNTNTTNTTTATATNNNNKNNHHHHADQYLNNYYLWLPVPLAKHSSHKWTLLHTLPHALTFLSYHLSHSHKVLITGDELSVPCCIVLATSLACYKLERERQNNLVWSGTCEKQQQTATSGVYMPVVGKERFDRTTVRQYLSVLARYCGATAVPGKLLLKQVYNLFVENGMVGQGRV